MIDQETTGTGREALLPHWSTWPRHPLISVLAVAWNEEAHLDAFLQSYAALPYPNTELILCAGGDDQTFAIAERWAAAQKQLPIMLVPQIAGDGQFGARQRCLAYARGEFMMLTDSDCLLHGESFLRLIHPLITGQATVTTGVVCPLPAQRCIPFVCDQWTQMHYRLTVASRMSPAIALLVGANCAFIRSLAERAYATTTRILIGEDTYVARYALRAGHQIRYVPESYVATEFPQTFWGYVRQQSRWRRDQVIHFYRFGNKLIVWQALFSVCKHFCWLALPLLPLLLWFTGLAYWGVLLWAVVWLYTFSRHRRHHQSSKQSIERAYGIRVVDVSALSLWQLIVADSCAVMHLALCMIIPAWRYRW